MRFARTYVPVFLSLLFAFPVFPQQAPSPTQPLQLDPQAITLVQQTLTTMGGAQALQLQDSVATGQAQIFKPDGTSTVLPITKKSGLLPRGSQFGQHLFLNFFSFLKNRVNQPHAIGVVAGDR